jgi:hypothetical protein
MRSRLPGWVLLIYLAIDLANPFVPGAFRFTPDEGLVWAEGTLRSPEEPGAGTSEVRGSAPPLSRIVAEGGVSGRPGPAPQLTAWLASVRAGDPPARDFPPPESDDH